MTGTLFPDQPFSLINFPGNVVNRAELDAFYFLNKTHDFIKSIDPGWLVPTLVPTAVAHVDSDATNLPGGGFWNVPFDIGLAAAAEDLTRGPTIARARVAGIVTHEYGHGLNYWLSGETPIFAKGMEEGNSEITATFMRDDPFGPAQYQDCSFDCLMPPADGCLCDNTRVFPEHVIPVQDQHQAGMVICGFNWDVRMGIAASTTPQFGKTQTAELWHFSRKMFGHSAYTMPDQVADYWLLDDDDGDPDAGVPHGDEIKAAAKKHGFDDIIWMNPARWVPDTVAVTNLPGSSNSIALKLDAMSSAHIAYVSKPAGQPEEYGYAKTQGGTWIVETIDQPSGGRLIDLELTSAGIPRAAFSVNSELVPPARFRFAERVAASNWQPTEFAVFQDRVATSISLAHDPGDGIHVAMGTALEALTSPPVGGQVRYAKKVGPTWTVEPTAIEGGGASLPSIQVAPDGTIGVSYAIGSNLRYASRPSGGTGWTIEVAGSGAIGITSTSLAFDANSVPHIGYGVGHQLRYVVRQQNGWPALPEVVDQAEDLSMVRGIYASLRLDTSGKPRITYHDDYLGDLRYAEKDQAGSWVIHAVDRAKDVGEFTSLELDPAGNPIVAYFQRTDGLVKIATAGQAKKPHPYLSSKDPVISRGASIGAAGANVPQVVRLCPAGDYDTLRVGVTLRDILGAPLTGKALSFVESSGSVIMASGGHTTAITNGAGFGEITLRAGSGTGRVGICADGTILGWFEVRAPDVAGAGTSPPDCVLPVSSSSTVASPDLDNTECGFIVRQGLVTPGVNQGWDLNGDAQVGALDINGWPDGLVLKGGWAQHSGHTGTLGGYTACGSYGKTSSLAEGRTQPQVEGTPGDGRTGALSSLIPPGKEAAVIPNPSKGSVRFAWRALPGEGGRLAVYDVTGRLLRTLRVEGRAEADQVWEWDGKGDDGLRVGSGIYFVRIATPRNTLVEKFSIVR